MNNQQQITSIIRQRGQLTIPDSIREKNDWLSTGSVVTIFLRNPHEIIIRPYKLKKKNQLK